MAFKIIWSDFAEMQLDQIFEYYIEKAGVRVAKNIIEKIILEPNKLLSHPEISQVEEFLLDREKEYRYLICDNYKIIYSIDSKQKYIMIADVFDTRQNPSKIKRTK
ncbi:Plasmid stabilization system protein ParE [Flavobacterium flevense]|uniref:Plasmid stabilization protein n=1 Tax=Flavobacterium flevense TaxID=983 RepID=A0A4Y4AVW5_9FLAO|nr:type II toxin-antitoxin system RelE/ParE family toxin [Flavobacterium flevense]GEC70694.1 plasmid stabilization protein [Flavobacterium flevense]SHL51296.1 Plasmid stabilization system protein ParE [Flavobacterium flevense]